MTINTPSFESPLGDIVSLPDSWTGTYNFLHMGYHVFGAPYEYIEAFGYGFDSCEDSIAALSPVAAAFDVGLVAFEDYEDEWDNATTLLTPTLGAFDLALDEFEDFEEEWNSRHLVIDSQGVSLILPTTDAEVRSTLQALSVIYVNHIADTSVHKVADTTNTITAPPPTDESTTVALANEMWDDLWLHIHDSVLTWHLAYERYSQYEPSNYFHPSATYGDAQQTVSLLIVALAQHLQWENHAITAPGYVDAYQELATFTNILKLAQPHGFDGTGVTDTYEKQWDENDQSYANWAALAGPQDAAFDIYASTEDWEDYEEIITMVVAHAPATPGSSIDDMDPTTSQTIVFTGAVTGTWSVQAKRKNETSWTDLTEINGPATYIMGEGFVSVRIYCNTYSTSTLVAKIQWSELIT